MNQFEKEYFEAESHWEGDMLSDSFNTERIRATSDLIPEDVSSLLDVGCGNGVFLNSLLADRGDRMELMGVDRSHTALKYVKTNKKFGDITSLEMDNDSFDCVTSLEVIEHLPVTVFNKALSELARVSRKYIIVSVPYAEKLEDNFTRCPSCKTMFNRDLHMRTFSEDNFRNLFAIHGYTNVNIQKLGKIKTFAGHTEYRKIFFRREFFRWYSPLCPVCGFREKENIEIANPVIPKKKNIFSYISAVPKFFWPKSTRCYWILGLFEKTNQLVMIFCYSVLCSF